MSDKGRKPWRVGRKVGRTIYDADDNLIGMMDTRELAAEVVRCVNVSLVSEELERVTEERDELRATIHAFIESGRMQ